MSPDDIPRSFVDRVALIESGGNPRAKAPGSSALGLFQFVNGTWAALRAQYPELGLTADGRTDPVQAEKAFRQFTADNARELEAVTGQTPGPDLLYLAHFLGVRAALRIILAAPAGSCAPVVGPAVMRANRFMAGMSCGDLRAWAARKVGGDGRVLSVPPAAPPARPGMPLGRGRALLSEADRLNEEQMQRLRPLQEG